LSKGKSGPASRIRRSLSQRKIESSSALRVRLPSKEGRTKRRGKKKTISWRARGLIPPASGGRGSEKKEDLSFSQGEKHLPGGSATWPTLAERGRREILFETSAREECEGRLGQKKGGVRCFLRTVCPTRGNLCRPCATTWKRKVARKASIEKRRLL